MEIKYDNCKDCQSRCEHAGKNREFICPGGKTCKVTVPKPKVYTLEEVANYICTFQDSCSGACPVWGYCKKGNTGILEWLRMVVGE